MVVLAYHGYSGDVPFLCDFANDFDAINAILNRSPLIDVINALQTSLDAIDYKTEAGRFETVGGEYMRTILRALETAGCEIVWGNSVR